MFWCGRTHIAGRQSRTIEVKASAGRDEIPKNIQFKASKKSEKSAVIEHVDLLLVVWPGSSHHGHWRKW